MKSHLNDHEARSAGVCGLEVDTWLIARDVEALDGRAGFKLHWACGSKAERGSERNCRELHSEIEDRR